MNIHRADAETLRSAPRSVASTYGRKDRVWYGNRMVADPATETYRIPVL